MLGCCVEAAGAYCVPVDALYSMFTSGIGGSIATCNRYSRFALVYILWLRLRGLSDLRLPIVHGCSVGFQQRALLKRCFFLVFDRNIRSWLLVLPSVAFCS